MDSCLGDDQIILSTITNENNVFQQQQQDTNEPNVAGKTENKMVLMWAETVDIFFKGSKTAHAELQHKFNDILNGSSANDIMGHKIDKSIVIEENDGSYKSHEEVLRQKLVIGLNSVTKIDWRDESFPKLIPSDFNSLSKEDSAIFNGVFLHRSKVMKYFHQTNLLLPYLKNAPDNSKEAEVYRNIPKICHAYAFQCSNRLMNPFNETGRSISVNHILHIMKSHVPRCNFVGEEWDTLMRDPKMEYVEVDGNMQITWIAESTTIEDLIRNGRFI